MKRSQFRNLLLEAAEVTTNNIAALNRDSQGKVRLDDEFEYEATYKAHLYHTLLDMGVSYKNLKLEMMPNREKLSGKHIDLWFEPNNGGYSYLIEVKQVFRLNQKRDNVGDTDLRVFQNGELKSGIVADVIKLTEACKSDKDMYGVMLMTWSDSRTQDNLELQSVKEKIYDIGWDFNLRNNIRRIELLWSSEKRTEYL